MRYTVYLLLFFLAQVKCQEYFVLSQNNYAPVPFAKIDFLNGKGTTTDENGKFFVYRNIDSIKITSLGFIPLTINLSSIFPKNQIVLQESAIALNEVNLLNKKSKILKHRSDFGLGLFIRDFTYDEKVITFIPYPDIQSDSVIIKSIVVNTTGLKSKERRYRPFKVNLYKVRKKYRPPFLKDSLITSIITSRKKDKPSLVLIDIEEQNIPLIKEGVYVSFETLDKSFYSKDSVLRHTKKFGRQYWHFYNTAAVETIKKKKNKTQSYSYRLVRRRDFELNGEEIIQDYWQLEEDIIYDITIEVGY